MTLPSSLYIHIPYCGSKCSYCDFFSVPSVSSSKFRLEDKTEQGLVVPQEYVNALVNQLGAFCKAGLVGQLETVYFGGGTPSLLSCKQLQQIMEKIRPLLQSDSEVTLEVNPESLSLELLQTGVSCGVNRISMGIQSFQDEVLGCVGRRCTADVARRGLKLLAKSGVAFCTDFIAGLPGQGQEDFLAGLEEVLEYNPYHISMYSLTVVEDTRLYDQIESGQVHWVPEVADSQWIAGRDLLERAGYLQYEVSNFAPVGQESRHNSAYWRQKSYIGIGSGAAGTLYNFTGKGEFESCAGGLLLGNGAKRCGQLLGGFRYTNSTNLAEYINFWNNFSVDRVCEVAKTKGEGATLGGGTEWEKVCSFLQEMPAQVEVLDRETLAFEHLMLALRMKTGVNCEEFHCRFGRELDTAPFEKFCRQGWMKLEGQAEGYTMTSEGLLFLNQILEELMW